MSSVRSTDATLKTAPQATQKLFFSGKETKQGGTSLSEADGVLNMPGKDGSNVPKDQSPVPKREHFYFIHGTGSTPRVWKKYDSKIVNIISENFGDEDHQDVVHPEKWSGANNSSKKGSGREKAMQDLIDKIYAYHSVNKGEPVILVGHSHGGNIALEVANKISVLLPQEKITLVTLNTPVRDDYVPNYGSNVKHFNFSIHNDEIQTTKGGYKITGKVMNSESGKSYMFPGLPPKGYVERELLILVSNAFLNSFGEILNIKIKIDESTFPSLGGEAGPAGNEFTCAVNIDVESPVEDGKETAFNKRIRHRIWHRRNLDKFKNAIAGNKEINEVSLKKGREEVEKKFAKYEQKGYKPAAKKGEFDQDAIKDATDLKAGLSKNAQKFLHSDDGKLFLNGLQECGENHALVLFCKLWQESELALRMEDAVTNKDGLMQTFLVIEPFQNKIYTSNIPEQNTEPPQKTTTSKQFISELKKYDPEAVKDCYNIIKKIKEKEDILKYLNSGAGEAFLQALRKYPQGHALWLFANNWRAAEPHVSRANMIKARQLAKTQEAFGDKAGKEIDKQLSSVTTDKKLGGYVKDGLKPVVIDLFIKQQEELINKRKEKDDPYYTDAMAAQDLSDLNKIKEVINGMEDDALELSPATRLFSRVRNVVKNPYVLEGLLIFLVDPTAKQTIPGADGTNTIAEIGLQKIPDLKTEKIKIPFGSKKTLAQGNLILNTTQPLVLGNILSGELHPNLGLVKSLSNELTIGGKGKPWQIDTNNDFTLPKTKTNGTVTGSLFKGTTAITFNRNKTEEVFKGAANYTFTPNGGTLNVNQKINSKEGSVTFTEGFIKNPNKTEINIGVEVKNKMFTQGFLYNIPKNGIETTKLSLGAAIPKDSKTLATNSDITLALAGDDTVKALSSFLEYKDTKEFLNMAASFKRVHTGLVQKEDFALALKKTWKDISKEASKKAPDNVSKDISFYLGGSFGMNNGKPARWKAIAGTEFTRSDSKYGFFAQMDYQQSDIAETKAVFTSAAGLIRDNTKIGPYFSNTPGNQFGIKVLVLFDASGFTK